MGSKNIALVYINDNKKIVKEGDNIDNIKILRILKDSIVIIINGEKKEIKLGYIPKSKSEAGSTPTVNLPPLENILPPNKNSDVIPKSELERLTSDPGVMFTQIRLIPVVEGGQTKGFRFDWIADGSLFQRMGLNVGDILVSINNQPINSGEDAFRILQIIRNEKSFKIAIIRNGQPVELSYTVD
ncbi:MAG: type II secretion system protein GspC [Hydrogenothermaceae bacterium]|nr:type II secretion system protein GspC [Hydrogenothermaceae bacterium]